MTITISLFLNEMFTSLPLTFIILLTLGVILVNGWTDAPNAIATCVSTKALKPKIAIVMAAILNFFGVFAMSLISASVAETIYNMVDFSGNSKQATIALCAALVSIIIWAVAAWIFGIPTSESHALIAGLSGAAIALQNSFSGINFDEWLKVIYGLFFSTIVSFVSGFVLVRIIEKICQNMDRLQTNSFFSKAQIGGAAAMAFMHGAQDGQKFIGVFLLGFFMAKGYSEVTRFTIPLWLMILCSLVMGLGTSIGGYRIMKAVGMGMAKLHPHQGFAADLSGAFCLLIASLTGLPVSTTHTKTAAIMGVGASRRLSYVKWNIVKEMILAWILTFPGCGLIGFIMAKLFFKIF